MARATVDRHQRAAQLLAAGAVKLYVGEGYATVEASKPGYKYVVTRDGCGCPDWTYRHEQVGDCCHVLAVRAACNAYRALLHPGAPEPVKSFAQVERDINRDLVGVAA